MTVAKATEKPSIDGALAKLGRGREHLEILEEAVRAYVEDPDSFGHEAIPAPTEEDVVREMACCLREIGAGRVPN